MTTWVLLHGFTGDPRTFDAIRTRLDGRVIIPMLPGHGPRPDPVDAWGTEVSKLAAWLEREGVRGAHLVGYSFGGRLGWSLAERDDLFSRATLIGAHPGLSGARERDARRARDAAWATRLERDGIDAFVAAWEALPIFESQRALPEETLAAQRAIRRSHTARGLADALRHLGLARMPPTEPRVPVELVVGERDARHLELARSLEHPLHEIPGVGHNVLLEAPHMLARVLA